MNKLMIKISLLVSLCLLILAGCATQPAYKAAKGSGYGYKDSRIANDRYRVIFKARGDDKLMAMDFALLRAAELTQQHGFDWFVTVSRETLIDQQRVSPQSSVGVSSGRTVTQHCGLLGCRSRSQPSTSVGVGLSFGDESREIENILEIKMGKGVRPENQDSYNAVELIENIKATYQITNSK